jgi:hypothetical protein
MGSGNLKLWSLLGLGLLMPEGVLKEDSVFPSLNTAVTMKSRALCLSNLFSFF